MHTPQLVLCNCGDVEHQLIFTPYEDENVKEVVLTYHLNTERTFLKRCWLALQYIFGRTTQNGHFGAVILSHENIAPIKKVCDFLEE